MRSHSERLTAAAGSFAIIACVALTSAPAGATGTMLIKQSNGETNTYPNVAIKVIHSALYFTSADGKSTIVINRAACSYQDKLMVCLPQSGTLVQSGMTSPLDLHHGTIYLNSTDDPQPLVLSTTKVAPHSVMASFTTDRGTLVSITGRIDKVVK